MFVVFVTDDLAMTMQTLDPLLTTGEAAQRLGSSRQHVVDLCEQGALPYHLVGRHRRVRQSDLERFARRRGAETLRREQVLGLWLGRAIAARVATDPETVLEHARGEIERLWQMQPRSRGWLGRWRELIERGPEAVMATLTSPDEEAVSLRATWPFTGLLPLAERDRIVRSFQQYWRPSEGSLR